MTKNNEYKSNKFKSTKTRSNDSKKYDSRSNETRSNDSKKYETRSNDSKKYEARNNDSKKYETRNNDSKKYEARNNDSKKYETRNNDSKKYEARSNDSKKYENINNELIDNELINNVSINTELVIDELEVIEEKVSEHFIEGRNAVLEAFRAGKTIDKLYLQEALKDGIINTILRDAKKNDVIVNFVSKDKLDQMSSTNKHQGVMAICAAYEYSTIDEMFELAQTKGEDPFLIILDEIEDPHNLGAIIRTANLCGAHGVIIAKRRAAGLTSTVVKASAGAINYTPVAKVTNIAKTIEELKDKGMWFACATMDGELMYKTNLKGSIGLVIGNEGNGVSRLVKEKCDYVVSIPMKGDIDSLNASVATGVLAYEIVRQRMN